MNILITGGTGLIGRRFINTVSGHQYTVLTRSPEQVKNYLPTSARLISSLNELATLDVFDAVINLAGEPIIDKRWTKKQKTVISHSRWDVTRQLVDLFRASSEPPAVFLSGSAIGVYGDQGDAIVDETFSSLPHDFAAQLCARWESIAQEAAPYTRVVCLRTGIVLDAQAGALAKMLLPFKLGLGGPVAKGEQFMSWIHIDDMVRAIDFLMMQSQCSGVYNLVAPEPVRNRDFTQALAAQLKIWAVLPAPKKLLQALLGESSALLLDSQRVVPKRLIEQQFIFSFTEINSALKDLLKK